MAALRLADLTAAEVLAFLDHSEKERHVSIGTRNCRLAALRSFFCFVADREPLAAGQCAEVFRIPIKRGPRRGISYLESAEVAAILAEPDRQTLEGQRDHALLALLYNPGARIQEALDLCPQAVRLESPAQVRLVGKGRKERPCPIFPADRLGDHRTAIRRAHQTDHGLGQLTPNRSCGALPSITRSIQSTRRCAS